MKRFVRLCQKGVGRRGNREKKENPAWRKHTHKTSNSNPRGVFHSRDKLKTKTCVEKKKLMEQEAQYQTQEMNFGLKKTQQWRMNKHTRLYQI